MNTAREIQMVNTFVVSVKRERYAGFLASAKRRTRFLRELYHFHDFDPSCCLELSGPTNSADGLLNELRRLGAPTDCYVLSVSKELDGATKPLSDVIQEVFTSVEGTIVCCIPGQLAYYEGEAPKNRYILRRRAA